MFYLLASLAIGIGAGVAAFIWLGPHEGALDSSAAGAPEVRFSDRDYHPNQGIVPDFVSWGISHMCRQFETVYPPPAIAPQAQHSFYQQICKAAVQEGELSAVVEGAAMKAILGANSAEQARARKIHSGPTAPHTLLIFGQRAQYYGQDVWCFLCLSSADAVSGTARVMVMSCTPAYGLVHEQVVGTF